MNTTHPQNASAPARVSLHTTTPEWLAAKARSRDQIGDYRICMGRTLGEAEDNLAALVKQGADNARLTEQNAALNAEIKVCHKQFDRICSTFPPKVGGYSAEECLDSALAAQKQNAALMKALEYIHDLSQRTNHITLDDIRRTAESYILEFRTP